MDRRPPRRARAQHPALAIVELDEEAVPVEVAIDEAVTLAKRYSSEDAGRLVNGILGRIMQETRVTPEDRLKSAEDLLDRLEQTRELEQTKDPEEAIEILSELSEIAKEVEAQLQQAKREPNERRLDGAHQGAEAPAAGAGAE